MATPKAAWGIEIGAYAIKAIRLERNGDDVAVSDFAVIPHKKVLTTPDLDQDEMIRLGLGQFISQKSLEGEHLVMSVPGHAAFARFAKLPPVEPKKVPDIVKFEAVQQIPFPIDEVEWDYETFTTPDTPEIEVGIFAITRERVQQRLGLYSEVGLSPEAMTLSPVAVYSAMRYDLGEKLDKPVIFLDIGTSATDVVIAEAGRCWIRTFPLGGTHFTEAIASAFKLSYSKAEKLKLEAADSKYAKQIMQAMRPVFSDLLNDLKRSIDFYRTTHRESEVTDMVGIGSTFKIPGLRKFLGQQLEIEVQRLDEYRKIQVAGREAAAFAENAVNMATAYGLALQGVGLAKIDANLVPVKTLREQMWRSKTKWFATAAAISILAAGATMVRPMLDRSRMAPSPPPIVEQVINRGSGLIQEAEAIRASADIGNAAQNMLGLLEHRTVWPYLLHDVANALASSQPQPELLGDKPELILGIDPTQRRLLQLNSLNGDYQPPAGNQGRRIRVTLMVELTHTRPNDFLNNTVAKWLRDHADPAGDRADVPYRIISASVSTNPTAHEEIEVGDDGGEKVIKAGEAPPSGFSPSAAPASPGFDPMMPQPDPGSGQLEVPRVLGDSPFGAPGAPPGASPGFGTPRSTPSTTPGGPLPTGPRDPGSSDKDLNEIAPLPSPPRIYPPNTRVFRAPITFEVELIDRAAPPVQQAAGSAIAGGASS